MAAGPLLGQRLAWERVGNRTADHGSGPGRLLKCCSVEAECAGQLAQLRIGQGAERWVGAVLVDPRPQGGARLLATRAPAITALVELDLHSIKEILARTVVRRCDNGVTREQPGEQERGLPIGPPASRLVWHIVRHGTVLGGSRDRKKGPEVGGASRGTRSEYGAGNRSAGEEPKEEVRRNPSPAVLVAVLRWSEPLRGRRLSETAPTLQVGATRRAARHVIRVPRS